MVRIFFILYFCCVGILCLANCGADISLEDSSLAFVRQAIINGDECLEGAQPEAVAIISVFDIDFAATGPEELRTVSCTGTLIAPDVVLTAAHCLDPIFFQAMFGQNEISNLKYYISFTSDLSHFNHNPRADLPEDAIAVKSWVMHEDYSLLRMYGQGLRDAFDLGLIFLEESVDHIRPAIVIQGQDEADQLSLHKEVFISGWGMQEPQQGGSLINRDNSGYKICATSRINEIGGTEIQIGSDSDSSRKCHGDSGGPSFMEVESESHYKQRLIGITSHAYDDSDCEKGGVDTRVDVFTDWIQQKLKAGCDDNERVWCDVIGLINPKYYDPMLEDVDGFNDNSRVFCSSSPVFLWFLPFFGIFCRRLRMYF